jgi:hypothetical protein
MFVPFSFPGQRRLFSGRNFTNLTGFVPWVHSPPLGQIERVLEPSAFTVDGRRRDLPDTVLLEVLNP